MKSLFTPAIALMNRMGYTKKFALLALVAMVAFGMIGYNLFTYIDEEARTLRLELQGLALIVPVSDAVHLIQQHRGLSAGVLGGIGSLQDERAAMEKEVTTALDALQKKMPADLASGEGLPGIRENWQRLQKEGPGLTAEENFTAHVRLIMQLLSFEVAVADRYALTLDPQLDTYYLIDTAINKLPAVIERLGRARAYGIGIMAARRVSASERVYLLETIGQLDDTLLRLESNLKKITSHNPAIRNSLSAMSTELAGSALQVTGIVTEDILTGRFATYPEAFFRSATREIDSVYAQVQNTLLPATATLLRARLAKAENMLYISIGVALLLLLIVVYFAIGIYHSIIDNVRSLAHSARAFAEGDLRARAHLGTHDELGRVGDSFNEMADGFNAMHEQLRESRDELHGLLDSMAEGAYGADTAGACTFVNRSFLQMLGYRSDNEVLGRNIHNLIHHSRADGSPYPENECKIYLASRANQAANIADEVFWRKDGTAIQVEYWAYPLMAADKVAGSIVTFVDISQRRRNEQALQIAQQNETEALTELKLMLNTSGEGFWKVDQAGRIIEANEAYCRISGYARDEIVGAHISKFEATEQTPEIVTAHIRQIIEQGYDRFETKHRHRNGRLIDIEVVTSFVAKTDCLIAFLHDVTERKQSEETLQIAAIAFETHEGITITDVHGNIIRVNRAFENITGYSQEEVLGKNPSILSSGRHDKAFYAKMWQQLRDTGSWSSEIWNKRKSGQVYPEYLTITAVKDNQGETSGYVAIFSDISERKQAEEKLHKYNEELETANRTLQDTQNQLRQSEKMLNDAQRLTHVGSWERDLMTDSFLCSEEAFCILEIDYAHRDLSYETFILIVHPEDREMIDRAYLTSIQTREPYEIVHRLLFSHGRMKWVSEHGTFHYDSSGVPLRSISTIQDITARKQAEEKLRKYNEELEAANHQLQDMQNQLLQSEKMSSIGQLAAGVAHEINNPIGYVYSNLGSLEKYMQDALGMIEQYEQAEGAITDDAVRARLKTARDKLDIGFLKEDLRALMNESKDGITRVKKIVQSLKDFSHVDASDELHYTDLHSGIESTLNIVNNEIKYKADVVREYGDIPEVECLPSQLNQVFMNLLVNAAHAIEERGTITLRTGRQDDVVWVEIADTGKGIAPEHLKKIFDPFFTTKPVGKGTGLGLSLSHGIIQKHHGKIEVRSEPGKGTTFRVWLPVRQPQAKQA